MELRQAQDMPELLRELGINYDPDRLAEMLKSRGGEVRARAIKVTASVGAFLARVLTVSLLNPHVMHMPGHKLYHPQPSAVACCCFQYALVQYKLHGPVQSPPPPGFADTVALCCDHVANLLMLLSAYRFFPSLATY